MSFGNYGNLDQNNLYTLIMVNYPHYLGKGIGFPINNENRIQIQFLRLSFLYSNY